MLRTSTELGSRLVGQPGQTSMPIVSFCARSFPGSRVRLPVSFGMLLTGETLIPSWGPEGKLLRLCLCLSCFLPARSDDKFTAHSGVVRSAHCWTWGDLAFYAGIAQLQ